MRLVLVPWSRALVLLGVFGAACAGSSGGPTGRALDPVAAPGSVQARRMAQLAPDYLARAGRAEQRARSAKSRVAQAEAEACASLLFDAALAEADRVELERRVLAEAAQLDVVARAHAAEVRSRLALADEITRVRAGRAAAVQAQRLLAAGSRSLPLQPSAAAFLVRRARATLAAARALGADPGRLELAEARLSEAEQGKLAVRAVLSQSERLLAEVRAQRATP